MALHLRWVEVSDCQIDEVIGLIAALVRGQDETTPPPAPAREPREGDSMPSESIVEEGEDA